MLSPGDVELVRSYVEAFGLQPVLLPDLSRSLDGHLVRSDYLSVSQGGTDLALLKQMGRITSYNVCYTKYYGDRPTIWAKPSQAPSKSASAARPKRRPLTQVWVSIMASSS